MIVRITGLRARGFHGVLESERREGQVFVADVALDVPDGAGGRRRFGNMVLSRLPVGRAGY